MARGQHQQRPLAVHLAANAQGLEDFFLFPGHGGAGDNDGRALCPSLKFRQEGRGRRFGQVELQVTALRNTICRSADGPKTTSVLNLSAAGVTALDKPVLSNSFRLRGCLTK